MPKQATVPATWIAPGKERLHAFASAAELEAEVRRSGVAQDHEEAGAPLDLQNEELGPTESPGPIEHYNARTSIEPTEMAAERAWLYERGDYFVLRRGGSLFTLPRAHPARPKAALEVFRSESAEDRVDALLLTRDRAALVNYRAESGAMEVVVVRIGEDGGLRHEQTFWLRAPRGLAIQDYTVRVLGEQLAIYLPVPALVGGKVQLPEWRGSSEEPWRALATPTDIVGGVQEGAVFHTVARCALREPPFRCTARAVLAPASSAFYVGNQALYLWAEDGAGSSAASAASHTPVMYRLPFAGGHAGAMRMVGAPLAWLPFDEGSDGVLRVPVRLRGTGLYSESSHATADELALARLPIAAFQASVPALQSAAYLQLPEPAPQSALRARFAHGKLVYAPFQDSALPAKAAKLYVCDARGRGETRVIQLDHSVERIDPLGRGALVSGRADGRLVLSTIDLERSEVVDREIFHDDPTRGVRHVLGVYPHQYDEKTGVLALPIHRSPQWIAEHFIPELAQVLFYRQAELRLEPLGELSIAPPAEGDSEKGECQGDCADFYHDVSTRPSFVDRRVSFAIYGEIVTARLGSNRIAELKQTKLELSLLSLRMGELRQYELTLWHGFPYAFVGGSEGDGAAFQTGLTLSYLFLD